MFGESGVDGSTMTDNKGLEIVSDRNTITEVIIDLLSYEDNIRRLELVHMRSYELDIPTSITISKSIFRTSNVKYFVYKFNNSLYNTHTLPMRCSSALVHWIEMNEEEIKLNPEIFICILDSLLSMKTL